MCVAERFISQVPTPAGAKLGKTENHADESWSHQCDAFSSQRDFYYSDSNLFPKASLICVPLSPLSDDCRPVPGSDALMNRRTLFEPFEKPQDRLRELGRPPQVRVRPILMRPDGASLVLGPFAETKGPRLPGRNPAP